jgi:filamentous hemagglutinin family protein
MDLFLQKKTSQILIISLALTALFLCSNAFCGDESVEVTAPATPEPAPTAIPETAKPKDYLNGIKGVTFDPSQIALRQDGNTLVADLLKNGAVMNCREFNLSQSEALQFTAPANDWRVMTTVYGSDISRIDGTATGPVTWFLVNPNGIVIGDSARINVNNFVASTLNISAKNFIEGNYTLQRNVGSPYGYILNEGRIDARNIALIASSVNNSGILMAKAGTVNLASGDKVAVSFDVRGLMQVEVSEKTSGRVYDIKGNSLKDAIKNSKTGIIEATQVMMTARTASDIFENAINNSGVIKATTLVKGENGKIRLVAEGAPVVNTGRLEAADIRIEVKGADFINTDMAKIIADGAREKVNGGNVYIDAFNIRHSGVISANAYEGGTAGNVEIISDNSTVLDENSSTSAACPDLYIGNGGRILINSRRGNTTVNRNSVIDVSAGAISGDGGFIEVSAFDQVGFYGVLNGRAPPGYKLGTAIIDPANASIGNVIWPTVININTYVWATNNITILGNITIGNNVILYLLADHKSAAPGDWDDGIGAIINNGAFIIAAGPGATGTCLNLKSGSGVGTEANPIRTNVHILSAQINPNSASGSIFIIQGSTNLSLTYILSRGDVNLRSGRDITLGYIAALNNVTLVSDSGAIINSNGGDLINIICTRLVLRAAAGIGSNNPIKARVSNFSAYNSTSGNIRFYNYGQNLTIIPAAGEDYGVKNDALAAEVEIRALPLIYVYDIDGNLIDWNVSLSLPAALAKGYLDANLPLGSGYGVEWATEDNAGNGLGWQYVGPGYTYNGNYFDNEAIYFDNDQYYAYIAIVQGLPITGGDAPGNPWFYPGDIGIDTNGDGVYEYAIDVSGYEPVSRTTQLYGNVIWKNVYYAEFSESNPWTINSGALLDMIDFVYSENQNSHFCLEARIPLSLLGLSADSGTLAIHWTQQCGNDSLKLTAGLDPVKAEPNLILTAPIYSRDGNVLLSAAGAIIDGNGDANNITANNLTLYAANGIGSNDPLEIQVSYLQATNTTSDNINISNTGTLTLTNLDESRLPSDDPYENGTLYSIWNAGTGNVYIAATGAYADLIGSGFGNSLCAIRAKGDITVTAGRDILLGDAINTKFADIYTDAGDVTVAAGRDIIMHGQSCWLGSSKDDGTIALTAGRDARLATVGFYLIDFTKDTGTVTVNAAGSILDDSITVEQMDSADDDSHIPSLIKAKNINLTAGGDIGGFNNDGNSFGEVVAPFVDIYLGAGTLIATAGKNLYINDYKSAGVDYTQTKYQLNCKDPSPTDYNEIIFANTAGPITINSPLNLSDHQHFAAMGDITINAPVISSAGTLGFHATGNLNINSNLTVNGVNRYDPDNLKIAPPRIDLEADMDSNGSGNMNIETVTLKIIGGGSFWIYGKDVVVNSGAVIDAKGDGTNSNTEIDIEASVGSGSIFLGDGGSSDLTLSQGEFNTLKADVVSIGGAWKDGCTGDIKIGQLSVTSNIGLLILETQGRILNNSDSSLLTAKYLNLRAYGWQNGNVNTPYSSAIGTGDSPLRLDVDYLIEAGTTQPLNNIYLKAVGGVGTAYNGTIHIGRINADIFSLIADGSILDDGYRGPRWENDRYIYGEIEDPSITSNWYNDGISWIGANNIILKANGDIGRSTVPDMEISLLDICGFGGNGIIDIRSETGEININLMNSWLTNSISVWAANGKVAVIGYSGRADEAGILTLDNMGYAGMIFNPEADLLFAGRGNLIVESPLSTNKNLSLNAAGDITINKNITATHISITADAHSNYWNEGGEGSGSISQAGNTIITASLLTLSAATGIGSSNPLSTQASYFQATNTISGDINVNNTGDLIVGSILNSAFDGVVSINVSGSILDDEDDMTRITADNIILTAGGNIGGFSYNGSTQTPDFIPMLDVALGSGALTAASTGGGDIYIAEHDAANLFTSKYSLRSFGDDTEIFLCNLTANGDLTVDASPLAAGILKLGGIDLGAIRDISVINDFIAATTWHLGLHAYRNVVVSANVASAEKIQIEAGFGHNGFGAITQTAGIIGTGIEELQLTAAEGISLTSANNVSKLQATNTASGDINIINMGTLTLINLDGSTLSEGFDSGSLYSIWNKGAGSVSVKTTGANADIISPSSNLCVVMAHGDVTLDAARDLILCEGTDSNSYGDVLTTDGTILLKAGNDIITRNDTYIYHTGDGTITLEAGNNITVAHIGFDLESAGATTKGTVNITAANGSIFDDSTDIEKTQGGATPSWIKANAINLMAPKGNIGGFNYEAGSPQVMAIPMLDVFLGLGNLTATAGGSIYIAEHRPEGLTVSSGDKYQLNCGDPSTESQIISANLAGSLTIGTPLVLTDNQVFLAIGDLNLDAAISSSANDLYFVATGDVNANADVELSGSGYYRPPPIGTFGYGPWIGFAANADQDASGKVKVGAVNILITKGGYIDFYGADIEINPSASINAEGDGTVPEDSGIGFQPNNGTNPNIFLGSGCTNTSLYSFILDNTEFNTLKADYVEFVEYPSDGDIPGNVPTGDITVGTLTVAPLKVPYLSLRTKGRILNQNSDSLLTAENLGLKAFGIKPDDSGSYDTAIGTPESPLNIKVVGLEEVIAGSTTPNKAYLNETDDIIIKDIRASTASVASGGSILDGNGAANNIIAADLILSAVNGIGSTGDYFLETQVSRLWATNTASGDIYIENTGDLTVISVLNSASNGTVFLASSGSILDDGNDATRITADNIFLTCNGSIGGFEFDEETQTPNLASMLDVELGTGNLTAVADGNIYIAEQVKSNLAASKYSLTSNGADKEIGLCNLAGDITVDAPLSGGNDSIWLGAQNIFVNSDFTTLGDSLGVHAFNNITINANLSSGAWLQIQVDTSGAGEGAITQAGGIIGSGIESLSLYSAKGIGTQAHPLDTKVAKLQAANTTLGDIYVTNTGDLVVGSILNSAPDGVVSLDVSGSILDDEDDATRITADNIILTAGGDIGGINNDENNFGDAVAPFVDICLGAGNLIATAGKNLYINDYKPSGIDYTQTKYQLNCKDPSTTGYNEIIFANTAGPITINSPLNLSHNQHFAALGDITINSPVTSSAGALGFHAGGNLNVNSGITLNGGSCYDTDDNELESPWIDLEADMDSNGSGIVNIGLVIIEVTKGGGVWIYGKDIAINSGAVIDAKGDSTNPETCIEMESSDSSEDIFLGNGAPGGFAGFILDQGEFDTLEADEVTVGGAWDDGCTGDIYIGILTGDPLKVGTVSIETQGRILNNSSSSLLTVSDLLLRAYGWIGGNYANLASSAIGEPQGAGQGPLNIDVDNLIDAQGNRWDSDPAKQTYNNIHLNEVDDIYLRNINADVAEITAGGSITVGSISANTSVNLTAGGSILDDEKQGWPDFDSPEDPLNYSDWYRGFSRINAPNIKLTAYENIGKDYLDDNVLDAGYLDISRWSGGVFEVTSANGSIFLNLVNCDNRLDSNVSISASNSAKVVLVYSGEAYNDGGIWKIRNEPWSGLYYYGMSFNINADLVLTARGNLWNPYALSTNSSLKLYATNDVFIGNNITGASDIVIAADHGIDYLGVPSDGSGAIITANPTFTVNAGGHNLYISAGDASTLGNINNINLLTLSSSSGSNVTFTSNSGSTFQTTTVKTNYHAILSRSVGTGSSSNPIMIYSASNAPGGLQYIQTQGLGSCYQLANNIDVSETVNWNSGQGFVPIGNNSNNFTGTFNGNNKTISNLYINNPSQNDVGLFGSTWSSSISNVGLLNVNITGALRTTGALVGQNNGSITNCYAVGSVTGNMAIGATNWDTGGYTGGLVGQNSGSISNSYANVNVIGGGIVGGLVGANWNGSISNSYATGSITGGSHNSDNYTSATGGLVGSSSGQNSSISNCYAAGDVNGGGDIGGLVGDINSGTISNSYATGTVTNNTTITDYNTNGYGGSTGGLVGYSGVDNQSNPSFILNSYATGNVNGGYAGSAGGLVGGNGGLISSSYATGNVNSSGTQSCAGGLVGYNGTDNGQVGSISDSYATGAVVETNVDSGDFSAAGGLVGVNDGIISNCYATGSVSNGTSNFSAAGGLVGATGINDNSSILNSYATGNVLSGSVSGGFIGYNDFGDQGSTITNCGWWTGSAAQAIGSGSGTVTYNETDKNAFMNSGHGVYTAGSTTWDISNSSGHIWIMAGYPHLQME